MTTFDTFRLIYSSIDLYRRSKWAVARRYFLLLTSCGLHTTDAGLLAVTPDIIIIGAKATAQDIYDRVPEEPLTINPQMLAEFRRKAERENPYQYVSGAHKWLMDGCFDNFLPDERERLANAYDKRMTKVRLVS